MSPRNRELGLLVPAAAVGLLGAASVASAQSRSLEAGPTAVHRRHRRPVRPHAHRAAPARAAGRSLPAADRRRRSPRSAWSRSIGSTPCSRASRCSGSASRRRCSSGCSCSSPTTTSSSSTGTSSASAPSGCCLATVVFGTDISGAKLWIRLPGGQTIQPSELTKVLLVIFLAGYLRDKRELLAIPTRRLLGMPGPADRRARPDAGRDGHLPRGPGTAQRLRDAAAVFRGLRGDALRRLGPRRATSWPGSACSSSAPSASGRSSRTCRPGSIPGCIRSPTRRARATRSSSRSTRSPTPA